MASINGEFCSRDLPLSSQVKRKNLYEEPHEGQSLSKKMKKVAKKIPSNQVSHKKFKVEVPHNVPHNKVEVPHNINLSPHSNIDSEVDLPPSVKDRDQLAELPGVKPIDRHQLFPLHIEDLADSLIDLMLEDQENREPPEHFELPVRPYSQIIFRQEAKTPQQAVSLSGTIRPKKNQS